MTEFTVTITTKPLGITFGHTDDNLLAIHKVKPNSLAYKLGLLTGDLLISINNIHVLHMESETVAELFGAQPTPFEATFERFDENYESDSDEDTNEFANYLSSNNSTPYDLHINTNYKEMDDEQEASECSLSLDTKHSITSTSLSFDSPNNHTKNIKYHISDLSPIITDYDSLQLLSLPENLVTPFEDEYEYDKRWDLIQDNQDEKLLSETDDNNCSIGINDYINMFDKSITFEYDKYNESIFTLLTSCHGFNYGTHEWSVKILKTDTKIQEIGVISNNNLDGVKINQSVLETNEFGARAMYGNERIRKRNYYASYNHDGHVRINKDLAHLERHKHGWCEGDVIKVLLNLDRGNIRFYINHKKVRKVISVQKNVLYYPFIGFVGNCKYELL